MRRHPSRSAIFSYSSGSLGAEQRIRERGFSEASCSVRSEIRSKSSGRKRQSSGETQIGFVPLRIVLNAEADKEGVRFQVRVDAVKEASGVVGGERLEHVLPPPHEIPERGHGASTGNFSPSSFIEAGDQPAVARIEKAVRYICQRRFAGA